MLAIDTAAAPVAIAETSPWHHAADPLDVDNDGFVVGLDAVIIINRLNAGGGGALPAPTGDDPPPYYDTSGDGFLTALDAVLIINLLNAQRTGPTVEAELVNDTAAPGELTIAVEGDNITSEGAIQGTITDFSRIRTFRATVNDRPVWTNMLPLIGTDGSFTLSEEQLAAMAGEELTDGLISIKFEASNQIGLTSQTEFFYILDTAAPEADLELFPLLDDLTPQIKVRATDDLIMPDGTTIYIDVDLDNDGTFDDPGETDYTTALLVGGEATFQVKPGLPSSAEKGIYFVNMRARVHDFAGNEGTSAVSSALVDTTPSDVLADYVALDDNKFKFSLNKTITGPGFTAYIIDMTSQQWRSASEVNRTDWQHWVTIIVPDGDVDDTALLHIDGGNNSTTPPSSVTPELVSIALLTDSVVIELPTVPNEPLVFTPDTPPGLERREDAIIAYSFDQFLQDTSDTTWPVLLAMVKSAVKTMDMVQTFLPTVESEIAINDFVVTGASKRGWTTWLTTAVDDRVSAMIPVVFDAPNLDEQMVHHYGSLGFFSPAIFDYEQMNIFERMLTPAGQALGSIVDPYRYLHDGRYNIPKFSINSAGDEFFLSDSSQFYFDDLPGPKYLRYVPNTGHGLNDSAGESLVAFYDAVLHGEELPEFSWEIQGDGSIRVDTVDEPTEVRIWQASNPFGRDFRHTWVESFVTWESSVLEEQGAGVFVGSVETPDTGATAFFVELVYPSGTIYPFTFTTDIKIATNLELVDWPFPIGEEQQFASAQFATASLESTVAGPTTATTGIAERTLSGPTEPMMYLPAATGTSSPGALDRLSATQLAAMAVARPIPAKSAASSSTRSDRADDALRDLVALGVRPEARARIADALWAESSEESVLDWLDESQDD